ncbi:MAG: molybdopterin-dependent oxidoreductase [Clostridiales Family XIII bacterium]|jgi:hypothetical protein|nr:molybdopterin-dependent oxidoreductase [Clostridiales Family XIII bacterium]
MKLKKSAVIVIVVFAALVCAVAALALANRSAVQDTVSDGSLRLYDAEGTKAAWTYEELAAFPFTSIEKTITSSKEEDESGEFTGVPLETLLEVADPDWASKYTEFLFHASDGFVASVFKSDIEKGENVVVVLEKDGAPLPGPDEGGKGPLRIVIRDDPFGNRSAYLLTAIEMK